MSQFFIIQDEKIRSNVIEFIKTMSIKRLMSIEIKQYRKSRSGAQNRTYWSWLKVIGDELGYTDEDMHDIFKVRFLGTEQKYIFGSPIEVTRSTRHLNTKEFAEYMTKVEMLASEMGIRLPHPDDYHFALMLEA